MYFVENKDFGEYIEYTIYKDEYYTELVGVVDAHLDYEMGVEYITNYEVIEPADDLTNKELIDIIDKGDFE